MRYLLLIYIALVSLISCQSDVVNDDVCQPLPDITVPEGYTRIDFTANISDLKSVDTRSVDPDGLDLNNMTLFCFNEYGLYISSEVAYLNTHTVDSGTFSAIIPNHTHIIHFLANHSEGLYDDSNFPGQTESMVIANMEGGSGMLVYWSRFVKDATSEKSISEQIADLSYNINGNIVNGVKLIRNQAKVTIDQWVTEEFVVTGYRTVNIPAFGTVAPHHPERHFDIVNDWETTDDFVTLPNNQSIMTDITDINTKPEDYIFETINSGDRLVSVIIRGHRPGETEADDKYYRVVLQNIDGSNFMIRRNHHYNIHIAGMLLFGQNSFEEALNGAASNNAWISIDEWVNEISDGTETLWVEQTDYVLSSDEYAGTNWTLPYKYTIDNQGSAEAPTVTWLDNNVAYDTIINNYNTTTGEGEITLHLYPMYEGNEQQVGSLLIKKGKLQRKITIYVIRTQIFTPAWISSHIYGVSDEFVTVVFTIPETCPKALFPFTVLVSVNHLDVRAGSGQRLPVYVKGEDGYFGKDWEGINYKYAYTVTEPGKHRLHMKSILHHVNDETEDVHLEAQFFETITKTAIFTKTNNAHRRIFIDGLLEYDVQYADDEPLYYMLVPQKRSHPVVFSMHLQERQADGSYTPLNHNANPGSEEWLKNGCDEFLIYTKHFSSYEEYSHENPDHFEELKDVALDGQMIAVHEDLWSTNGRVMAYRTYDYNDKGKYRFGMREDGKYNIYMFTHGTNSQDVVRISSNREGNYHAFAISRDSTDTDFTSHPYDGNEYRSIIFNVGHYRPFRFAAQIRVTDADGKNASITPESTDLIGNKGSHSAMIPENIDNILFKYKPGQRVDILLDVTSFHASDGCSVHPFGEEFDIYIDAPMLEIDYSRIPAHWLKENNPELREDKLRADPTTPGRYIYTVDRYREQERAFGDQSLVVANIDDASYEYNEYGEKVAVVGSIAQSGERKVLPFKKTSITVGGGINITTDKDKVIFWDKTFNVETSHIMGNIYYRDEQGDHPIPHNSFVAFVRLRTGARIGVATIYEDGKFELNLREEYKYSWTDDPIDFYYTIEDNGGNKITYNLNYEVDGEAKSVDLELLNKWANDGTPIILTRQM